MCKIATIIFKLFLLDVVFTQNLYSSSLSDLLSNKVNLLQDLAKRLTNPFQIPPDFDDQYDFIIIGSGSSGGVIASRLSEISTWKILLLEAGNPGNIFTTIPILAPLFQLTPYNWNYTAEKQKEICLGMIDQKCAWPRGKALGGTSVINYMIYTRGNPKDYEKWASMGNPDWSYNDVLPYFKKSENCKLNPEICNNGYHNITGPLTISYPYKTQLTDNFLEAGVELGGKIVDYNSRDYMGFARIQANIKGGQRVSTADAFIYPKLQSRRNLRIITSARVTKILINPNTKTAYGVKFRHKGKTYIAKASKEVILSAGALNSPQLLMLSGIGPEDHLNQLKIPIIQNLPVGQLLYDHIAYLGLTFKINQTILPREVNTNDAFNWLLNRRGVFTSLGGIEALAYINTGSIPDLNYPDIELLFVGFGGLEVDMGLVIANEIRLRRDIYETVYQPLEQTPSWTIIPMLLHPKSRGYIKLKSTNPYDPPLFYGNYFTDPNGQDIKTLLASIRYIQKLSQTHAFQNFNSKMHDTPIPGCENFIFDSDEYWICALRILTSTLHHQISTCKMGPENDPEAVVDARLRVYGVRKLRVIDSSVIPITLSAHTNAPSIMIGEKGSDIIKEDWGLN